MILRQVSPAIVAWALSVVVVVVGARRQTRASSDRPPPAPEVRQILRYLAVLTAGGYVTLLGIVLVVGVWFAGLDASIVLSAARGGLLLAGVAATCFILLSWVAAVRAR